MMNVVVDTDVFFRGITGHGASFRVIQFWQTDDPYLRFCLCNTMVMEYEELLRKMLSAHRWQQLEPVFHLLIARADQRNPHFRWGPSPSDRDDEFMVNCAMNANAAVITYNVKDYRWAEQDLHLPVLTPEALLRWRVEQEKTG